MVGLKCVVVGDTDAEKTRLIMTYVTGTYPTEYEPTVFDNYAHNVMTDGELYSLGLSDTTGQEDYADLRQIRYSQTDVFLVCFSVVSPTGFENVKSKWIPEITHHCPHTPYLLVGTRTDLRDDEDVVRILANGRNRHITQEEGEILAEEIQAEKYMECSAAECKGVNEVFLDAIKLAQMYNIPEKTGKKCVIL